MTYKQRETSHPVSVVVEAVNYPSLDQGPGAEVTYTITLAGRKREVAGARLKLNTAKQGSQIGPGDATTHSTGRGGAKGLGGGGGRVFS